MVTKIEAIVKPEMLIWARDSAGFDAEIAAKKIQVKAERLRSWESGESRPTIKQLRNLAKVYKRPIAVFYLPTPPKDFQALRDFRRLPGQVARVESPELRFELRRAQNRRELALELSDLVGDEPTNISLQATLSDDPERVAREVRSFLGVPYEAQVRWKSAPDYESFNNWRSAVEDAGILVFQLAGVQSQEIRGFSISDSPLPAIVLNNKDSLTGRIFTMLHELCHILLREGGLCDLTEEFPRPPEEQAIEIFCNRVAAATLIPRDYLLLEHIVVANQGRMEWTEDVVIRLANRYGVSREAMLRRLLTFGLTTEAHYQTKRKQYFDEYEAASAGNRGGFSLPHTKAVSSAGHLFVKLVLDNYRQDNISASDVSDFLDVRLKHLDKVEAAVLGTVS